jgi:hypothetical protein
LIGILLGQAGVLGVLRVEDLVQQGQLGWL